MFIGGIVQESARLSSPNASLPRSPLRLANVKLHTLILLFNSKFSEPQNSTTDGTGADDMGVASEPFGFLVFCKERQGVKRSRDAFEQVIVNDLQENLCSSVVDIWPDPPS